VAHIVPNPPNRDSANQSMQKFNILTTTGEADIFAWGLPNAATEIEFTIAFAGVGPDNSDRIVVSMAQRPGPYANMRRFHLKGLRTGDQIAIYRNSNFGQPYDINWVQHSAAVTVDKITADRYGQALVAGTLPKYAGNPNIELYPYGALQCTPPISEQAWLQSVVKTLDTISANALGRAILGLIKSRLVIHPWVPPFANARSDISFTPQNWNRPEYPGMRADEILLHEFIHVLDSGYSGYTDAQGFKFDSMDFLSVNATNVYSCLLGRGLRKDHQGFDFLPNEYFTNPRKHFDDLRADYDLAKGAAPQLYSVLKSGSKLWNPFAF
jgi:hypothetical protein